MKLQDVYGQAMLDAKRTLCALHLEEIIQDAIERDDKDVLKNIFCLEFDPMEAGYAS